MLPVVEVATALHVVPKPDCSGHAAQRSKAESRATGHEVVVPLVFILLSLCFMYSMQTTLLIKVTQLKRNKKRFPIDFIFPLTPEELSDWKSQNVISNKRKMGMRKLPNVFTEQGVAMLSSVLNSEIAILVIIQIIRIFARFRQMLSEHAELRLEIEN